MQQLVRTWSGLGRRRQIIVAAAAAATVLIVMVMSALAARPSMQLLYAGLEPDAAGEVVQALEQHGVAYRISGNAIHVPASRRDELRMILAGDGLPATGGRGYELLDSLSGFGTTAQMFDATYWRAKEGELARTIVASPHVSQARVHIAHAAAGPFQRAAAPTASVLLTARGGPISPEQANAIRYLVASAITGMEVGNVAVIDSRRGLVGPAESETAANSADERSQQLRSRVLRLLEARVGAGNAVVEVSVETVTDTESIRRRQIDPEERVAISTDTEERRDSSRNQGQGEVTIASHLPEGDGARSDGSQTQSSETRERVNYEVSQTEHEILRGPGAVRRLTVAVLVNGVSGADAAGAVTVQPRAEAELEALRELVASAVGFDAERGDVITLRSMELPAVAEEGTMASTTFLKGLGLDLMSLIQILALAIVAIVLGLFVVRPILARPHPALPRPETGALPKPARSEPVDAPEALTGEIDDGPDPRFESAPVRRRENEVALAGAGAASPSERLRAMIGERQEQTVEILRSWLDEQGESA